MLKRNVWSLEKVHFIEEGMLFPDYLLWKKTEQAEAKNPERRNLIFKIKAEYSTTLAILNYHRKKKKNF